MGKFSRTKGFAYEREISIALRLVFPNAHRQLEYQENHCKGVDIAETGHYKIQCKRGKKYASLSAIKEVIYDELFGEVPVLITKGDHEKSLVVLPLEEFIRLLAVVHGNKESSREKYDKGKVKEASTQGDKHKAHRAGKTKAERES